MTVTLPAYGFATRWIGRSVLEAVKDQKAGGHGVYLRQGIGQAVLYRHFIRSADAFAPWFTHHGLDRVGCRAALAFPIAAAGAAKTIDRLRDLAARYDVEVIQFVRPGGEAP